MTNQELNLQLKAKAAHERTLTKEILWDIVEVERRKLYLAFAYPSLFAYLTECIGYSEGAAQRRIDAARLLAKVPEISQSIENGSIHLAQVSKMQRLCRQIKKDSGRTVEVQVQKNIMQKLEHKNSAQTDLILAQELNVKIELLTKKKIQKDESVRVELTFSKEEMALLEAAQAILSNKIGGNLKDSIVEMAKKVIKDTAPKKVAQKTSITAIEAKEFISNNRTANKTSNASNRSIQRAAISTATVAVKIKDPEVSRRENRIAVKHNKPELKSVTPRLKREILQRDLICQFKNPTTGKVCGSRFYLEVDHIQPRFMNGPNTHENLRMLCKNHNQFRYSKGI